LLLTAFSFPWIISKLSPFLVTDPLLGSSFSLWLLPKMGSSDRLFNRQRTLHEILGGGQGMQISFLINFDSMSQLYWWFVLISVSESFIFIFLVFVCLCSFWYTIWFNSGIDIWAVFGPVSAFLFSFFVIGRRVRTRRREWIDNCSWSLNLCWINAMLQCSCRFNTVETEEPNDGDIVGHTSCLGCVWKIWLYTSVSCFQCFPPPHCHSFPLGQVSCDSQQVTVNLSECSWHGSSCVCFSELWNVIECKSICRSLIPQILIICSNLELFCLQSNLLNLYGSRHLEDKCWYGVYNMVMYVLSVQNTFVS